MWPRAAFQVRAAPPPTRAGRPARSLQVDALRFAVHSARQHSVERQGARASMPPHCETRERRPPAARRPRPPNRDLIVLCTRRTAAKSSLHVDCAATQGSQAERRARQESARRATLRPHVHPGEARTAGSCAWESHVPRRPVTPGPLAGGTVERGHSHRPFPALPLRSDCSRPPELASQGRLMPAHLALAWIACVSGPVLALASIAPATAQHAPAAVRLVAPANVLPGVRAVVEVHLVDSQGQAAVPPGDLDIDLSSVGGGLFLDAASLSTSVLTRVRVPSRTSHAEVNFVHPGPAGTQATLTALDASGSPRGWIGGSRCARGRPVGIAGHDLWWWRCVLFVRSAA